MSPIPIEAIDNDARGEAIGGADIVFAAGAIGIELLDECHWRDERTIELIADCNAQPPLGVGGIESTDKGHTRQQKLIFGALGIGQFSRYCAFPIMLTSAEAIAPMSAAALPPPGIPF